ncbi:MAG: TIGR02453 family protein [Cyclobacteriaceae bacterium]|nr:MAG: TIGR02453 family protein [Cyclobacteriaceae bacterium]
MSATRELLKFLKQLKQNNSKEWMLEHKPLYLKQRETFLELLQKVIEGVSVFDTYLQGLEAKECIFRINRDIRFSKDKTLYKTHFGGYMAAGGRKSMLPGYYLHLDPGDKSFLAAGLYRPGSDLLKKVRQEIDYNGKGLISIVENKHWKDQFGELQGERLATAPKNYSTDHPLIKYLQLKSFMAVLPLKDTEVTDEHFSDYTVETFKRMNPLVAFLNTAIS